MSTEEYCVSVTFYDEISTVVVDASSKEDAIAQAKNAMEKLVRGRCVSYDRTPADIEEEVVAYRDRYSYSAGPASRNTSIPREVIDGWREPRLPTGCPR